MGPLLVTNRIHHFIVVDSYYLTKFVEEQALKTSAKKNVVRFMYERIIIHFGIPLEMILANGPQFTSEVSKNLIDRLAITHVFTIMWEPSTNGLVEQTNNTLYSMIANKIETRKNASDWDLKIDHAMFNSTFKTATGFVYFV